MNQTKQLRSLLGVHYDSNDDFNQEKLDFQLKKTFKIPIKIKSNLQNNSKDLKSFFYSCLNNQMHCFPKEINIIFFYDTRIFSRSTNLENRFFYFFNDQVEVSFLSSNHKLIGSTQITINENDFKKYKYFPQKTVDGFLEITLLNRILNINPVEEKINKVKDSIKHLLTDSLIPLGVNEKNYQKVINLKYKTPENGKENLIKFFKNLKIELSPEETLHQWKVKVFELEINWGFKDLQEYNLVYNYFSDSEARYKIIRGQTNLKHLIKKVEQQVDLYRQNHQNLLKLLENYQKEKI